MKKQFTKIKIAAENLSRSNKSDQKDFELETIEKQVEKYKDVLEKMVRKLPAVSSATDTQERDKRIKKNSHYKIGQSLDESSKELSKDMPLHHALANCGELEKFIAECIVDSELETETEVVRRFKQILDSEIQDISTLRRNVSRTLQEYTSLKRSYEASQRLEESQTKINHIKDQQEQCEVKLERERDAWAAKMFELIAKEDEIVQAIRDYVLNQRNYHERALLRINSSLAGIQDIIQSTVKSRFGTSLKEQLTSTNREISYVIELCICCLIENGLTEEGILRVGCASTKLRRMKRALEAQHVKTPLPVEYQDPHVIGSILKLYLRELPEPLLTYKYYKDFIHAVEPHTEAERKAEIKATLNKLPAENYANLRYLTKFLSLVTQQVELNKMNSQNVAIVMSPNMLWPREDKNNPADYMGQVNCSSAVNIIVELLISQWDYFFEGEVDFFITLQRHRLFVEGKSKSNSSNEHLDRHDGDSAESPRYGTIRRQKACAPSPPAKAATTTTNNTSATGHTTMDANSNNCDVQIHKNGDIKYRGGIKDLFPQTMNNSNEKSEKPEKPPLPKVLQLQQHTLQQQIQSPQQQYEQQQQQQQQEQTTTTPKPVPMTRTQFFGLDNLPSPVADRKSSDSVNSLTFKPDLPQKPKIPKRPMVLSGLQGTNKSDDEGGVTPTNDGGSGGGGNGYVRHTTEKFIEKLRQDNNCDNGMMHATTISGTLSKENNRNNQEIVPHQAEPNANNITNVHSNAIANTTNMTATTTTTVATSTATLSSASDNSVTTTTTTTTQSQQQQPQHADAQEKRNTPTTPISPNMMFTPKRPTVPAPPPPCIVKKQAE